MVEGPGGVELRVPEGAVDEGVVFKIEAFDESLFPPEERPEIDAGTFGGGLKIESHDEPTFKKEVDLVFPKPVDAPDDAFYYVYRRLVGPNGEVAFEVIDHAFVEGEGESAKVVTASYPFGGYTNSFGVYSMAGTPFASQIGYMFLMWSNEQVALQPSHMGVITGKVLRRVYTGETGTPQFVGIPNVLVSGTDDAGNSLIGEPNTTVAISQGDGTFTLYDQYFDGGTVEIAATINGDTRTATAYEYNIDLPALVYYRKKATANITFPAEAPPPPPPQIDIRLMEVVDGSRQAVNGLVVAGTPLLIGFRSNYDVRGAEIEGEVFTVQVDPLRGIDPLGMDFIINGEYTPPTPGAYTVKASAVSPFGGTATASITFKVIAEGGGNNEIDLDNAPEVITLMTVPKNDATGVPVTIFPQVSFTEPVKNLAWKRDAWWKRWWRSRGLCPGGDQSRRRGARGHSIIGSGSHVSDPSAADGPQVRHEVRSFAQRAASSISTRTRMATPRPRISFPSIRLLRPLDPRRWEVPRRDLGLRE